MFSSIVSKGVEYLNILPVNKSFYVTRLIESVMENKPSQGNRVNLCYNAIYLNLSCSLCRVCVLGSALDWQFEHTQDDAVQGGDRVHGGRRKLPGIPEYHGPVEARMLHIAFLFSQLIHFVSCPFNSFLTY
jgi:hypothetical protein